jgi:hypothetical protein
MEKRREWDREAAGEVFLASDPLYHWVFGIGDGKEEPAKVPQTTAPERQRRSGCTNPSVRVTPAGLAAEVRISIWQ